MSLLIKALDKAEKALEGQHKVQQALRRRASNIANQAAGEVELDKPELALTPEDTRTTQASDNTHYDSPAVQAANVFEAKQPAKKSINPMLWFVAFGVLALMAIAFYFYQQLNQLQSPPVVVAPISAQSQPAAAADVVSPAQTLSAQVTPSPASATPPVSEALANKPALKTVTAEQTVAAPSASSNAAVEPVKAATTQQMQKIQLLRTEASANSTKNTLTARESVVQPAQVMAPKPGSHLNFAQTIASDSASIQISKSKTQLGVNPELTRAYEAYVAGNDSDAQALYKRVLQRDVRNVDALLGMGAIAERQGRLPDALGWYQKVLEVEPRNTTALTAYYAQTEDKQDKELKLKNLIANAPNSANVYADLADYYAENNRWSEAQQAYFEAYRLNKSAENAFNLAVSLDQLGKPAIALPYYQEALALSAHAGSNAIDQSALQKRIAAIQAN